MPSRQERPRPAGFSIPAGRGAAAGTAGSAGVSWAAGSRGPDVPSTEPDRIRPNDTRIGTVSGSPSSSTPAATATAGFTYVNTSARLEPTSLISAKKTRNASAVQSSPSPASAASTCPSGSACGQVITAGGAYTRAASARQAAVIGSPGTSARLRAAITGAMA